LARQVWGIDVGRSALKAIRMQSVRGAVEITDSATISYEGQGADGVQDALIELREQCDIHNDKVVVSVPGSETFIRSLRLVLVGKKSVHDLVQYEAQQEIPFVLDEVIWDYDMFEPADPESREREGLIFAVKKNLLNNYFITLAEAELPIDDVQTAPLALYNFFRYDQEIGNGCLVIDIGAAATNLVALSPAEYWIRSIPVGGRKATELLGSEFGMDEDRAEAAKINMAKSKHAKQILEVLLPSVMEVVGEVQKSLSYQRSQNREYPFEYVSLVGGGGRMMGMKTMMARSLSLEVASLEQFGRIGISDSANIEPLQQDLGSFAVAAGLALQGCGETACDVSLIPQRAARRTMLARTKPYFVAVPAAILLTLAVMFGFGLYEKMVLQRIYDQCVKAAKDEVTERHDELKKAMDLGTTRQDLQRLVELGQGRTAWLDLLVELSGLLPNNTKAETPESSKVWLIDLNVYWPEADVKKKRARAAGDGRQRLKGTLVVGINMKGGSRTQAWMRMGKLVERKLKGHSRFVTDSILVKETRATTELQPDAAVLQAGQRGYFLSTIEFEFYVTP